MRVNPEREISYRHGAIRAGLGDVFKPEHGHQYMANRFATSGESVPNSLRRKTFHIRNTQPRETDKSAIHFSRRKIRLPQARNCREEPVQAAFYSFSATPRAGRPC